MIDLFSGRTFKIFSAVLLAAWWSVVAYGSLHAPIGSPDESANAFFAQHYATTGTWANSQTLTETSAAYWHPRSVVVDGTTLKPLSFLGLPWVYGLIIRFFSEAVALLFLPTVMTIGLWSLYRIFRRFHSPPWSLFGTVLVALHPVYFLFSCLPYYHNGLFAGFLLIAGWRLMRLWDQVSWSNTFWLGFTFGLALFFRPVEVLWTAPLIVIVLLAQRHWKPLVGVGLMTLIVQIPWLIMNAKIYGTPFGSGYAVQGISELLSSAGKSSTTATPLFLTPPGGWSWNWIYSFWQYFMLLLPTWAACALVGFVMYLRRIRTQPKKVLKISLVTIIIFWAFIYYGSWNLYPLEIPSQVGALSSYARYWIIFYVALSVGVLWVLKRLSTSRVLLLTVATLILFSQVIMIGWHPTSGWKALNNQSRTQALKKDAVLRLTPQDAAIIAGHMDKVIFPDRTVSFEFPANEADWEIVQETVGVRPVFLYGTPRQYEPKAIAAQLLKHQLKLEPPTVIGNDTLWEIRSL